MHERLQSRCLPLISVILLHAKEGLFSKAIISTEDDLIYTYAVAGVAYMSRCVLYICCDSVGLTCCTFVLRFAAMVRIPMHRLAYNILQKLYSFCCYKQFQVLQCLCKYLRTFKHFRHTLLRLERGLKSQNCS